MVETGFANTVTRQAPRFSAHFSRSRQQTATTAAPKKESYAIHGDRVQRAWPSQTFPSGSLFVLRYARGWLAPKGGSFCIRIFFPPSTLKRATLAPKRSSTLSRATEQTPLLAPTLRSSARSTIRTRKPCSTRRVETEYPREQ